MGDIPDLSEAFEKVRQMLSENDGGGLQNLLGMLTGGDSTGDTATSGDFHVPEDKSSRAFSPSDIDMLFKIKRIMAASNGVRDNNRTRLLTALKPFLKSERQEKLEQAVRLANAAEVLKMFRDMNEGGG